jgi:hypothetical protein
MPNAISPEKRSITFLENRRVIAWMESVAQTRDTDLSVILREATSAYYAQHGGGDLAESGLFAKRAATKAVQRTLTAQQIATGVMTPGEAQERNAPIQQTVKIVNLWPAIRRRANV